MNFPSYKNNSIVFFQKSTSLEIVSRESRLEGKAPFSDKNLQVDKVVVHLAWLKDQSRGFCEADDLAFFLICGKWGQPTKSNSKLNWAGEVLSSSMGLQAVLSNKDVLAPFLDRLALLF